MNNDKPKKARCYFCKLPCVDDDYCYGCQEFICSRCDERGIETPFGSHSVGEHKEEK